MIRLQGVSRRFAERAVLDGADLHVPEGHTTAVVGPSGSGKTTLLRIVAGLDAPEEGLVTLGGTLASRAGEVIVRPSQRGVGMVFQDLALWPHMTVEQNIGYGLRARRTNRDTLTARVRRTMTQFHLETLASRYPTTLSAGERQRVALARTLVVDPKVLLLDEPVSNLDRALKTEFLEHLARYRRDHPLTLLYVSHHEDEIAALSAQIVQLDRGRIVAIGAGAGETHGSAKFRV